MSAVVIEACFKSNPAVRLMPTPDSLHVIDEPIEMQRAGYVAALLAMEWEPDIADARACSDFRAQLIKLQNLQMKIDPVCVLWKRHAHPAFEPKQWKVVIHFRSGERATKWLLTTASQTDIGRFYFGTDFTVYRVEVAQSVNEVQQ